MQFSPISITLDEGSTLLLQSARPHDAVAYEVYFRTLVTQSPYMVRTVDELCRTEDYRAYFEWAIKSEHRIVLLGYIGDEIVASGEMSFIPRRKLRHRASVSVGVLPAYWRKGIATTVMQTLEQIARDCDVAQLELECMSGNERALSLYAKLGFERHGVIPDGVRQEDGTVQDLVLMRKVLSSTDK